MLLDLSLKNVKRLLSESELGSCLRLQPELVIFLLILEDQSSEVTSQTLISDWGVLPELIHDEVYLPCTTSVMIGDGLYISGCLLGSVVKS